MPFPQLHTPPIDEVVCGFRFPPTSLDAMDFGIYWRERSEEFPRRELHPALLDGAAIHLGANPLRAWLISKNDDIVVQLQHDRFFVNWRRRATRYPRFSSEDGGLKKIALAELAKFQAFCTERSVQVDVQRIELTKIDILRIGEHFTDSEDLTRLLRVVAAFRHVQSGEHRHLVLQFAEDHPEGLVQVAITGNPTQVRIETRVSSKQAEDISEVLDWANERANHVFFGLLDDVGVRRFQEAKP